jgi:hypothetical protein
VDTSDPDQAESREELAECLRRLYVVAGKPSYRTLEQRTAHAGGQVPGTRLQRVRLGRSTITDILAARKFPGKAFMLTFVEACGIDPESDRRWAQAWDRLALADAPVPSPAADDEIARLRQQNTDLQLRLLLADEDVYVDNDPAVPAAETERREELARATKTTEEFFLRGFDRTLYGMPDNYDEEGEYLVPEGFDAENGVWLPGYERERDEWEEQHAAARARFDARRSLFRIDGCNLEVTVPVTGTELAKGASIRLPLLDKNPVLFKLSPGTASGYRFRLPAYGGPAPDGGRGYVFITVKEQLTLGNGDRMRAELFG